MQVALAWLLQRSPNVLPIPGTSSVAHLRENLAAAELKLPADVVAELDSIAA
jgi:aryl-alcohol dehydrogenase-like predicted oxidoreductase